MTLLALLSYCALLSSLGVVLYIYKNRHEFQKPEVGPLSRLAAIEAVVGDRTPEEIKDLLDAAEALVPTTPESPAIPLPTAGEEFSDSEDAFLFGRAFGRRFILSPHPAMPGSGDRRNIYAIEYFYTTIKDSPGSGARFLRTLAEEEVNLLAFNAFPVSSNRVQLVIYPLNSRWLGDLARREGLRLIGPHHAILVHGDDALGSLVGIHQRLADAGINVPSSNGITDGRGGYRYILHFHPDDFARATAVLEVGERIKVWGPDEAAARRTGVLREEKGKA